MTRPRLASARLASLLVVAALGLGADCDPERVEEIQLAQVTAAPPGATAVIENPPAFEPVIRVTAGVVVAVRCWDSCDYTCVAPTLEVADPAVARVRPVFQQGGQPRWALVASAPGATMVTVSNACAQEQYALIVEAP